MRRRPSRLALAASLVVGAATLAPLSAAARRAADPVAAFDALAEQARRDWGVPGLAVVVVRDGQILLAKGYGVRELGRPEAVGSDTLFAAASTTKAMTTAAIGMLVDEGKLGWDDPVRKFVPELQLGDPQLADSLTVRDLLTHHTGLPETDALWYTGELDWPGILAHLSEVEPTAPARSRFEYQNVMYGIAGEVVGRVSGMPWTEFVRAHIFAPLGMTRAVPLGAEAMDDPDHVTPHSREDGPLARWETLGIVDPIPAAGSVWISASDEARWIRFLLDPAAARGADGEPLLSSDSVAEIFRPQVVIQPGGFYPTAEKTEPHWTTYGLGWFQQDYRGRKIDFHTGSIDGLVAIVGLARDQRFGVAVFGNLDHAELRHALMFSAFDLFLDGDPSRDWNGELRALYDGLREKADARQREVEAKRVADAPPSLPLARYAGTYEAPLAGSLECTLDGEDLVLAWGKVLRGRVTPWNYDTFRVEWERKMDGVTWTTFRLDPQGEVESLELFGVEFTRRRPAADAAESAGG